MQLTIYSKINEYNSNKCNSMPSILSVSFKYMFRFFFSNSKNDGWNWIKRTDFTINRVFVTNFMQ